LIVTDLYAKEEIDSVFYMSSAIQDGDDAEFGGHQALLGSEDIHAGEEDPPAETQKVSHRHKNTLYETAAGARRSQTHRARCSRGYSETQISRECWTSPRPLRTAARMHTRDGIGAPRNAGDVIGEALNATNETRSENRRRSTQRKSSKICQSGRMLRRLGRESKPWQEQYEHEALGTLVDRSSGLSVGTFNFEGGGHPPGGLFYFYNAVRITQRGFSDTGTTWTSRAEVQKTVEKKDRVRDIAMEGGACRGHGWRGMKATISEKGLRFRLGGNLGRT